MFASKHGQRGRAVVLAFFLAVISSTASAFTVQPTDVEAERWIQDQLEVDYRAKANLSTGPKYKTIPVKYQPSRVVKYAKKTRSLNPGSAAVSAAVGSALVAYDMLYDELTESVGTQPVEVYDPALEQHCQDHLVSYTYLDYLRVVVHGDAPDTYGGASSIYYTCVGVRNTGINVGGEVSFDLYVSKALLVPTLQSSPVSEQQLAQVLQAAFADMSPQQILDFFRTVQGNPELFPELATALDLWADELAQETAEPKAQEAVQPAEDMETVKIDEAEVNVAPDVLRDASSYDDIFAPIRDYSLPGLPSIPQPSIGLSSSSSCQTITLSWSSASVVFPNSSQCSKLNQMKDMMEWLLSVMTLFSCWYILLGVRRA